MAALKRNTCETRVARLLALGALSFAIAQTAVLEGLVGPATSHSRGFSAA